MRMNCVARMAEQEQYGQIVHCVKEQPDRGVWAVMNVLPLPQNEMGSCWGL